MDPQEPQHDAGQDRGLEQRTDGHNRRLAEVGQCVRTARLLCALFLCCGMIEKHAGSDRLDEIGGLLKRAPWLAVVFFIGAMALMTSASPMASPIAMV